ncbi:MAG: arginine--tRNA ligase [Zoogloeaceae bacterium]|jgi:arginyl-tRNA synthetase|nr:arginine--tRNA ligase [Zoogloeaceae bacterium]
MSEPLFYDPRETLSALLRQALASVAPEAADAPVVLERPREAAHGDFSSNLAMRLAKRLKQNPRLLAERLCSEIPVSVLVKRAEVAGSGFINFILDDSAKHDAVRAAIAEGARFGRGNDGAGQKILLEFVSANPTGPLHVGHGRGAAYGASLANLLAFRGWDVTREYYVNDAGRQMDILALSTWLRYQERAGETLEFPPNAYQGDYVREMAEQLFQTHGARYRRPASEALAGTPGLPDSRRDDDEAKAQKEAHLDALIANGKRLLGKDWLTIHQYALTTQLADGREDLEDFGARFEVWFSEKALFDTGLVARAVEQLRLAGHLYEQDGATWFRSTAFGDEKDRVVQRENGLFTYFASDIAYHFNKFERGFTRMINIWGADHHGYIARVKGALTALGLPAEQLEIALVQFAVLYRNGQKASMSTRSGDYVTLRDLRREVGNDACRFFYVIRKADQHLDFDLDLAKSQSNDNPVYYIQYARARIASVLREWRASASLETAEETAWLLEADFSRLSAQALALAAKISRFPETADNAARERAPHHVAFYLKELAAEFHAWYNAERILTENAADQQARLALAAAAEQVIRNGMGILGVSCPERLSRINEP